MWDVAAECFPPLLAALQPHFVLILGRELAARVPRIAGSTVACEVPHPSSFGFEQSKWSEHVHAALDAPA
jgi:hypothetical protein